MPTSNLLPKSCAPVRRGGGDPQNPNFGPPSLRPTSPSLLACLLLLFNREYKSQALIIAPPLRLARTTNDACEGGGGGEKKGRLKCFSSSGGEGHRDQKGLTLARPHFRSFLRGKKGEWGGEGEAHATSKRLKLKHTVSPKIARERFFFCDFSRLGENLALFARAFAYALCVVFSFSSLPFPRWLCTRLPGSSPPRLLRLLLCLNECRPFIAKVGLTENNQLSREREGRWRICKGQKDEERRGERRDVGCTP